MLLDLHGLAPACLAKFLGSIRQLLDHAADNGYGIPAFNVNNVEQVQAVMGAASEVGALVILQASAGARKYAGEPFIKHLIQATTEVYPWIPLVMHQDHGQSPAVCKGVIDLGFSSVMMGGSLEVDGSLPRIQPRRMRGKAACLPIERGAYCT